MLPTIPVVADLTLNDYMLRFALAAAIGVLAGIQRESVAKDSTLPGARTFAILSLVGAISSLLGVAVLAAAVLAALAVAFAPMLTTKTRPGGGATTIAAAVAVTLLGALAVVYPPLAAAVAVELVVTLAARVRLHRFVEQTLHPTELVDALKFFVVALIALPLLPDQAYGPFGGINPHSVGLLVTALTGIGWLGYIAVRAFGASKGLPLAGLAGGLVSSTATTASMARRARATSVRCQAIAAALLSKVSSLATLSVLVAVVCLPVLTRLAVPLGAMAVTLLITSRVYAKARDAGVAEPDGQEPAVDFGRPFTLKPALLLAGVITAALFLSKLVVHYLGGQAVIVVAAVTGIADTQAAAVATADIAASGTVTATVAAFGIVAAILTNTVFKIVLAFVGGGRRVGVMVAAALAPAAGVLLAATCMTVWLWP